MLYNRFIVKSEGVFGDIENMESRKICIIIQNLRMLLLLATIVTFNLIIGANEKGLRVLPISILLAGIVIYLIVIKIQNKKQGIEESIFFKSKVDYFVLAFMLTTTLPLIFGTYVSYSDTVEFIMKYFFIYVVYILARNTIKEKKQIEYVMVTTLISSLIPIFLHIDYLNKQYLIDFLKWIDITYKKQTMFESTFGYANTQAIYSAFCIFLAMHRFKVNKNKLPKILDIVYIIFSLYIIHLVEAQSTMLLFGITIFILLIFKYRKQIIKYKKNFFIGTMVLLCFMTVYLSIALQISQPIIKKNEDINEKIFYRFKKDTTYLLEIDYEVECLNLQRKGEKLEVLIFQFGEYFRKTIIKKGEMYTLSNKYIIEFTPTNDTKYIKLQIINGYYGIIKINNVYINGEKQIVDYKYIPNNIGNLLTKFVTSGKSLQQRLLMYKDSLKIAKDSPIIGNGGNTWKNVSKAVEEYKIAIKETHSYFFELLINYGIAGVATFLILVIYFFVKVFKQCKINTQKRNEKLLIALGLFIMLFHSITFDFHMAFMLIQLIVYIYIAVLLYDEQSIKDIENKKQNIIEFFVIAFLVFILSLYIRADISKYLLYDNTAKHNVTPYKKEYYYDKITEDIENNKHEKDILNELRDFMKKEPYYNQTESYEKYFNIVCKNLNTLSNDELKEYLEFGIKRLQTIKFKTPLYLDTIFARVDVLVNTTDYLKNYITEETNKDKERKKIITDTINELKNIINKEYEINKKNIENIENGDYGKENRNGMLKKYKEIIDSINTM